MSKGNWAVTRRVHHAVPHRAGPRGPGGAALGGTGLPGGDPCRPPGRASARCRAARGAGRLCRHPLLRARQTCEWGTWGLVAATQAAAEVMLTDFPEVRHVYLASGSCLPLRPVEELVRLSGRTPAHRFHRKRDDRGCRLDHRRAERRAIHAAVPVFAGASSGGCSMAMSGCSAGLGFRRRIPQGIVPHLGSQWWCLTRQTLSAILEDPDRAAYDRYFRRVWIPDESYFQTLVRHVFGQCRKPVADPVEVRFPGQAAHLL